MSSSRTGFVATISESLDRFHGPLGTMDRLCPYSRLISEGELEF